MKRKTVIGLAVALAVGLAAPGAEGKPRERSGQINVKTKLTLEFPAPSTYAGNLAVRKVTVARKARHRGEPASPAAMRRAKARTRRLCNAHIAATPVRIVHQAPDVPATVIGSDVPGPDRAYSVSGGSPATEDLIIAEQERRRRGHLSAGGFRWRFTCQRGEALHFYPF